MVNVKWKLSISFLTHVIYRIDSWSAQIYGGAVVLYRQLLDSIGVSHGLASEKINELCCSALYVKHVCCFRLKGHAHVLSNR